MLPRHALRSAGAGGSLRPGLCALGRELGLRGMASGAPTTATPPPDLSRAGTADLCDVHVPEPVDVVAHQRVDIMEPIFRQGYPKAVRCGTFGRVCKLAEAVTVREAQHSVSILFIR
jgi:hypothetical protein